MKWFEARETDSIQGEKDDLVRARIYETISNTRRRSQSLQATSESVSRIPIVCLDVGRSMILTSARGGGLLSGKVSGSRKYHMHQTSVDRLHKLRDSERDLPPPSVSVPANIQMFPSML